jgi:hypothetical protein
MLYEYDVGDSWVHSVILEDILSDNNKQKLPECIAGARRCPPEDCGGSSGYEELLAAIKDSKHEDHHSMMEWLGGKFDPEKFNLTQINKLLHKKNFGCG